MALTCALTSGCVGERSHVPDARHASLVEHRVVPLGVASGEWPAHVGRVGISGSAIAVVDDASRRVRVYDWSAKQRYVIPYGGRDTSMPGSPRAIEFSGDTLLVADGSQGLTVWRYDQAGRLRRRDVMDFRQPVSDFRQAGSGYAVATTALDDAILADTAMLVALLNPEGKAVARFCKADTAYARSLRQQTMHSIMRGTSIAVDADTVYCAQVVSPSIRRFVTPDLREERLQSPEPPFYLPGERMRASMDVIAINQFAKHFTALILVLVSADHILSVYSGRDTLAQRNVYHLWNCRRSGEQECAFTTTQLRPLGLKPPDTLVLLNPRTAIDRGPAVSLAKLASPDP